MTLDTTELAVLTAIAARNGVASLAELEATLAAAGVDTASLAAVVQRLIASGYVTARAGGVSSTSAGSRALLTAYTAIEAAVDNSPRSEVQNDSASVPLVTELQTEWIEAVSLNYAVDPDALRRLLPHPLQPEIFEGTAWVQLLMSSLRDMRPQGMGSLFGVNFYQASYRAAVHYRDAAGNDRRGGYFVRSETNHAVMRAIGNTLVEFKFHAFGAAQMYLLRDDARLTAAIDAEEPGGKFFAMFDTTGSDEPPKGSVWSSLAALQRPLVECYDAYGIDPEAGYLYTLTIDREPWRARFVTPLQVYAEYFDTGDLGGSVARLDSVLHIPRCGYRWRPLRREPLPP